MNNSKQLKKVFSSIERCYLPLLNYEVKTYGYQPFKVTYYDIKPVFFDNAKRIQILINQYEECHVNKKNCNNESDLKMKKLFGKYVIYKE